MPIEINNQFKPAVAITSWVGGCVAITGSKTKLKINVSLYKLYRLDQTG